MFFGKKSKKENIKCDNCKSTIDENYSFCPFCGQALLDFEKQYQDFGMLGKNDFVDDPRFRNQTSENNLSITDKMISALVSSLMKNIDQQFREGDKPEIQNTPRGIRIKIGMPGTEQHPKKAPKHDFSTKKITDDQIEKMSKLPRVSAKTNVKRIGDKLIYELDAPGVESVKDVFVSKLESGYEVKAIGAKKVYINSLPVTLPITSFAINQDKLLLEFSSFN